MKFLEEEIYLLPYEKSEDKRLMYVPIRGCVFLVDQRDADLILSGDIVSFNDINRHDWLNKIMQELKNTPLRDLNTMRKALPLLNIDFSSGCNMRCIYCYAGRGDGAVEYQEKDKINQILDIYFKHLQIQPECKEGAVCSIAFTNDAEPTFAPELLKYTVMLATEKAKALGLRPFFTLPTNGAFQKELRSFIIDNFYLVSISFDGLPWIQNLQRPLINGEESFNRVFQNAKAIYESGVKLQFSVVITNNNVGHMLETIDFFHKHFPGTTVTFGQVNLVGRVLEEQRDLLVEQHIFDEKFMTALRYGEKTSIKVTGRHGSKNLTPRRHYCSSTAKPNLSVSLSGEIYACMEEKSETMKIGKMDFRSREMSFNYERIKNLQEKSVDQEPRCRDCFAKYLCAGGCVTEDNFSHYLPMEPFKKN